TRDLVLLERMNLSKALPFAAGTFAVASFASMGLPGFSGFAAELQVLIGAWHAFPVFAVLAGFGILVGVAYTLRVLQKSFFGDVEENAEAAAHPLPAISIPERIGALILLGITVLIGLYPKLLLDLIGPSLNSPLFEWLNRRGTL
ncbi:MAG TPA: proton-conducting transporter membrane subunit, partial [Verrucomicrobiae bacterium]|nr:proton-conducting transporter membrane subunit [Verrucomicrobiae bacterium]